MEERNDRGVENARFTRYAVALSVNVETPSIKVRPLIALFSALTRVVDDIDTIASCGNHQSMEISNCNFIDLAHVELGQLVDMLIAFKLVVISNTHRPVQVRASKFESIINLFT